MADAVKRVAAQISGSEIFVAELSEPIRSEARLSG